VPFNYRSRLYFKVLQILRIFSEAIQETKTDMRAVCNLTLQVPVHGPFLRADPSRGTGEILCHNWEVVTGRLDKAAALLLERIDGKVEEIKSLRDGVG
jgi:hypothetical protein